LDLAKISDLNDLQILLDLMTRYQLSELELEGEGRKIRLKKLEPHTVVQAMPFAGMPFAAPAGMAGSAVPMAGPAAPGVPAAAPAAPPLPSNLHEVKSPMVGTFYRAPSPEADPFVREGDRVEESTVLCIIEAMKVMNEITAGCSGVVKEILGKNGESVEFGQPLFRIQTE
jgi:acetyl-CoA carboxylase biotin carboxyl carrier protein